MNVAVQLARKKTPVNVVASDTDVLVLLPHHFETTMSEIYVCYEVSGKGSRKSVSINIQDVHHKIKPAIPQLLCAHVISGCDSTS